MATSFEMTDDGGIRVRRGAASISRFEAEEVAELRALLGIPGLTPEQAEVALAERELAVALGVNGVRNLHRYHDERGWYYSFTTTSSNIATPLKNTQAEAAQAAVARVRELRAEKERAEATKLPEPETMDVHAICWELQRMGHRCEASMGSDGHCYPHLRWRKPDGDFLCACGEDMTAPDFHRYALRRARELDGAK